MELDEELAQLDAQIEAAQVALVRQQADLDALRARRDSLRRSMAELERMKALDERTRRQALGDQRFAPHPSEPEITWADLNLGNRQRTDAIVEILEFSPSPMRIPDVIDALNIATREEHDYQVVASTLAFLSRSGRITNISRGLYGPLERPSTEE